MLEERGLDVQSYFTLIFVRRAALTGFVSANVASVIASAIFCQSPLVGSRAQRG